MSEHITESLTEKGNDQITIVSPNFGVVAAEIQLRAREGWFIVDQPVCYINLYEVVMQRSYSSVKRGIERLEKVISDKEVVGSITAKAAVKKAKEKE